MKNARVGLIHEQGFDRVTVPTDLLIQLVDTLTKGETEKVHTATETYKVHAVLIGDISGRVIVGDKQ
ncbi:hypothetical protein [Terrihalobacillus insolitus]|uniref:hypothetical protein n=1 Tax=Terrihalobacillus insolitus TaxID=2950438 RepID=UPI0023415558|nr:hypothetical protein [Terrihalobacillus insolitus]MDC3412551.1 hypothetical protein [Terrihalobacillus insolitus]